MIVGVGGLMTFRGHIRNGRVEIEGAIPLPEGTEVEITRSRRAKSDGGRRAKPRSKRTAAAKAAGTTLYDRLKSVIGKAKGLPADFADQHDRYIHGAKKR
jgi:hypothetical protein